MNVAVNVLLARGYSPGKQFSLTTMVLDHRNPVTQGHSSRIATIADTIGRRLGMSSDGLENLRAASFLHDVGHIKLKVGGEQFEAPGHAEEGAAIVAGARFAPGIAEAVKHHHARWDGTGYSEWLADETLPRMARVLAVAERFEALTAGRGCPRSSPQAASETVAAGAGTEFDPAVVEALKRAVGDGGLDLHVPDLALPAMEPPALPSVF